MALLLSALILLVLGSLEVNSANVQCSKDSDCLPATCCHSTACLPTEQAVACTDGKTSQQCPCEPFTMDCGGKCFCTELKQCAAMLNLNSGGNAVSGGGGGAAAGANKKKTKTYGYTKVSIKK